MKLRLSTLLFLFTVAAYAEPETEGPKPPKGRPPEQSQVRDKMRGLEFWKKFDVDQDQKLTKEEFAQLPRISQLPEDKQEKLFTRLDKNQNGALEAQELLPPGGNPNPGPGEGPGDSPGNGKKRPFPRLAEMDKNADKKIDFSEFILSPMISKLPAERQKKIFENMDRNKDGALSPEDGPPPGMNKRPGDGPNPNGPNGPKGPGPRHNGPNGPNGPNGNGPRPDDQPQPNRGFVGMDLNQDKLIDFTEFQKAPISQGKGEDAQEDLFEIIDHNDDLKIDEPELKAHWEAQKNKPKPTPPSPKPAKDRQAPPSEDEMMMEGA